MRMVCLLMVGAGMCLAQEPEATKDQAPKFYKLDFVVKDVEGGKTVVAHNYTLIVADGHRGASQIRAGSKVPVGGPTTYQTIDIGTNIDCNAVTESHDELSFDLLAEVSSILQDGDTHPVIRQNKWVSRVVVPLKKPTVVFASDDNTTKRVLELEVTATPRP